MGFNFDLPVIIDGTGSCSELTGDDPDNVCCEEIVVKKPEILISAKGSAIFNGFNAVLSPTYGITHSRLEDMGFDDNFTDYITSITKHTVSVSDGTPVGGVIAKSDPVASEYGENVFDSAYFAHLERITLMKGAGADFVLLRNFDKLWDMRAGVLAAKSVDMPVFVTMNTDDEGKSESDTDFIAALITLQALGADAFGIECDMGIAETCRLIQKAFTHSEIPLIAAVDLLDADKAELDKLYESGVSVYLDLPRRLYKTGADSAKGSTQDTSDLSEKDQNYKTDLSKSIKYLSGKKPLFDPDSEKDSYAAAIYREAFFLPEYPEFSEPLVCDYDMSDEIIDFDDEAVNAIYVNLNTTFDAAYLADNAIMSKLPFAVHTDDATILEAALRYYQGRLIVDSHCGIDESIVAALSKKYGAVLY